MACQHTQCIWGWWSWTGWFVRIILNMSCYKTISCIDILETNELMKLNSIWMKRYVHIYWSDSTIFMKQHIFAVHSRWTPIYYNISRVHSRLEISLVQSSEMGKYNSWTRVPMEVVWRTVYFWDTIKLIKLCLLWTSVGCIQTSGFHNPLDHWIQFEISKPDKLPLKIQTSAWLSGSFWQIDELVWWSPSDQVMMGA